MYSEDLLFKPVFNGLPPTVCESQNPDSGTKIIVLDRTRNVIKTSVSAQAMLADGTILRRCFGRLETSTRANATRLETALDRADSQGHSHLILTNDAQQLEADLIVVSSECDDAGNIVMVFVSSEEKCLQRIIDAQTRFGLTRAEGRLLAALFEGCSVPQAAHRLGVARTTARTHLQRVFDKTGARRQGDLLRLVAYA